MCNRPNGTKIANLTYLKDPKESQYWYMHVRMDVHQMFKK
jgi:hypothetical protein